MKWAEVDWNLCRGCNPCSARTSCKTRAIVKFPGDDLAFIELDRCRGCGKCLAACDYSAIRLNGNHSSDEMKR